jgi:signal transduction histidine kinase
VSSDEVGTVIKAFNDMLDQVNAALERERDANRLKDEFLATLSHELRTPLNAVLGWARILRSSPVQPATQQRALESIERNAQAQGRLIEDLLEISRIVTGKLRLHVVPVDLAAVARCLDRDRAAGSGGETDTSRDRHQDPSRRDERRPRPSAAGRLEPALERREVHAV